MDSEESWKIPVELPPASISIFRVTIFRRITGIGILEKILNNSERGSTRIPLVKTADFAWRYGTYDEVEDENYLKKKNHYATYVCFLRINQRNISHGVLSFSQRTYCVTRKTDDCRIIHEFYWQCDQNSGSSTVTYFFKNMSRVNSAHILAL